MKILHTKAPLNQMGSTWVAGHPSGNMTSESIEKTARRLLSASGNEGWLYLTVDDGQTPRTGFVCVNHTNNPNLSMHHKTGGAWATNANVINAIDSAQRRTSTSTVTAATALGFQVSSQAPAAPNYLEVGAVYLFENSTTITDSNAAPCIRPGGASIRHRTPGSDRVLMNGQTISTDTGPAFDEITLKFLPDREDEFLSTFWRARNETIWLDMQYQDAPWMQWPVRWLQRDPVRNMDGTLTDSYSITLTEVV